MTNFSSNSKTNKRFPTPEQALLLGPILLGSLVSLLLTFSIFIPSVARLYGRYLVLQDITQKISDLPQERLKLERTLVEYTKKNAKYQRLFALLAGTQSARTFLAEVNHLMNLGNVAIEEVSPLERPIKIAPQPPSAPSATTAGLDSNPDPLLITDVEKRSFDVTFQAPFANLLELIRKVEELESLVVLRNAQFEAVSSSTSQKIEHPLTKLKVNLSIYGRSPRK